MANLSVGFYRIQSEYINKCDDDVGKVNLLAIFLLVCKRMKQQNMIIGFPLGQKDVIKINSKQLVAIIFDQTWKYQKLSMDPNIFNFGNMN